MLIPLEHFFKAALISDAMPLPLGLMFPLLRTSFNLKSPLVSVFPLDPVFPLNLTTSLCQYGGTTSSEIFKQQSTIDLTIRRHFHAGQAPRRGQPRVFLAW